MNRAVMLRMAACGIMGLGAALLIAALLLWTYTTSRITKIPLDLDTTLIGDGSGRGFPPTGAIILDAPRRAAGDASGGRWQDRRTMLQAPMPRNQRSTDAGRKRSAGGIPAGRRMPKSRQ